MINNKMIAHDIKWIFIKATGIGLGQPFVEFKIKDFKTQSLRGADFPRGACQPCDVMRRSVDNQAN